MQTTTIRLATLQDIPTLLQFEQAVIETERPMDCTIKYTETSYYDLNQLISATDTQLLVVERENNLIASGYARIEKAKNYNKHEVYAYLGFMYVLPEYRGQGINQLVIKALMEWCRTQGVYELRLDVYATNEAAIKAYQKVGFVPNLLNMRIEIEKE